MRNVISHSNYFKLLPKPDANPKINIAAVLKKKSGDPSSDRYHCCSRAIQHSTGIEFKVSFDLPKSNFDYKVHFRVENHGKDASKQKNNGDHSNVIIANREQNGCFTARHWEDTTYTGLHYMFISVLEEDVIKIPESSFGVYVGPAK